MKRGVMRDIRGREGANDDAARIMPGSGGSFRDAPFAPEMVVAPAGRFAMGSRPDEAGHCDSEGPQHEVTIPQPFAVGRYVVTFAEWDAAQADADWQRLSGLAPRKPNDQGWGRGNLPVIDVSWDDARAYAKWLSHKTGRFYRLPSEAQWEYAARARTGGAFSFDNPIATGTANFDGNFTFAGSAQAGYRAKTVPVDSFQPNRWGLYQVHGNVWEWVADCWNASYADKPDSLKASGEAWTAGDCAYRVLRGGSWADSPLLLRSAARAFDLTCEREDIFGFRLVRALTP